MIKRLLSASAGSAALFAAALASQPAVATEFSFATISGAVGLSAALDETDAENLAFVVTNGIKAGNEPCSDRLYNERKAVMQSAKNGVIVSLAASDWVVCSEHTKLAAGGRLNRLRELLFSTEFSTGGSRLPLVRQSTIPKFRSYSENARWEIGGVMFATVNLPSDNNHYVVAAGRNNEFEDRSIANRDWIHRLFVVANIRKIDAIVLFSDGDPLTIAHATGIRDGFAETRRQLTALASRFAGKVLLVHGASEQTNTDIRWHGNIGELAVASGWLKVTVNTAQSEPFSVDSAATQAGVSR